MRKDSRILVSGRSRVVGPAIHRLLVERGYRGLITGLDGLDQACPGDVARFVQAERPDYIFLTGGMSGGIGLNQRQPAELLRDNLEVTLGWTSAAHRYGVGKLLYLASSCVYPRECPQPMTPDMLMTGPFESTNEAYATAKLAGIALCQSYQSQYGACFLSAIPGDAFGPGDEFDSEDSHVVPALIGKIHRAKVDGERSVELWGTGRAVRGFSYSDDIADACIFLIERYEAAEPINVSSGESVSIAELAEAVREVVGYQGELRFDTTRPDGMPVKTLDTGPLEDMGWRPRVHLREGLTRTYRSYLDQHTNAEAVAGHPSQAERAR